jgi:hypothetical protein
MRSDAAKYRELAASLRERAEQPNLASMREEMLALAERLEEMADKTQRSKTAAKKRTHELRSNAPSDRKSGLL